MSNFVSETNAADMMEAIAVKKLTVTDVMPAASALVVDIPYLYLGATTQDYTNGSIYKCQEVTPATDPKTYEWVEKYRSDVDLTKYKRIWGGTKEAWDLLPLAEKIQYDYTNFKGDAPTADISGYQKKTLDTPLTIDGTQQTTVEGALDGLNTKKINSSAIANNLTTTTSGKVLDARQGKALNDKISELNRGYTVYTSSDVASLSTSNSILKTISDLDTNGVYLLTANLRMAASVNVMMFLSDIQDDSTGIPLSNVSTSDRGSCYVTLTAICKPKSNKIIIIGNAASNVNVTVFNCQIIRLV